MGRTRFAWVLLFLTGCNTVLPDVRLAYRETRARFGPAVAYAGDEPDILPAAAWQQDKKAGAAEKFKTLVERLQLPAIMPGAEALQFKLPPMGAPKAELEATLKKYFPPLPPLPMLPLAEGTPLTLADLQDLAKTHSPVLRQAALDIEAVRGSAIQAGLHPNPTVGYEGDDFGVNRTAGKHGLYIEQTVKTAGKLKLARAAALMEMRAAEAKYSQVEADLLSQVRGGYFAVLAAHRSFEVQHALTKFTEGLFEVGLQMLRTGEVAPYEPLQTRVLAVQARTQLVQSQNRYSSAWLQLAAALGTPAMPLTPLTGEIERPVPHYEWEQTLARVLHQHSSVQVAAAAVDKTALQLELARVQPIPDMALRPLVQYDSASEPRRVTAGMIVGVQLPLFDRNQGRILEASALHRRALEEHAVVQAALTSKLADAFERYRNNRELVELYRRQMLPNQVQAFRAAVARHAGAGPKEGVSYYDLVTAEQTLVNLVGTYLNVLRDQWTAAVDIGALLQEPDFLPMEK